MAAILKILNTKSTTLSDDLFLCRVTNGSAVRFPFNIFCILDTMATTAILNFLNPTKAATHYDGYSYKVSWSLMKGIQNIFWAYLVPLDMDVVPIKFNQFLFGV